MQEPNHTDDPSAKEIETDLLDLTGVTIGELLTMDNPAIYQAMELLLQQVVARADAQDRHVARTEWVDRWEQ